MILAYVLYLNSRPGYRQRKGRQFREDPYVFLDQDSDVYNAVGYVVKEISLSLSLSLLNVLLNEFTYKYM